MTKCHFLLLAASLLLLVSCKPEPKGPSLSQYGAQSEATQNALFEQYVLTLLASPPERARQLQDSIMTVAESDSTEWQRITKLEELYLLDPNSPYRNEELFIPVLEHFAASPLASEEQRAHAAWLAPRITLNRPGQVAADFDFISPKGRRENLHATIDARKPQRTLLFFSNPGCPNCKEITETFCGYDPDQMLNSETVYWLRAIPSLYLLDEEKRVILKDAPLNFLLAALR